MDFVVPKEVKRTANSSEGSSAERSADRGEAARRLDNLASPSLVSWQQLRQEVPGHSSLLVTNLPLSLSASRTVQGYPVSTEMTSPPQPLNINTATRFNQLLAVVEEMSKDVRPTYAGSKNASERFKRGLNQAKLLVRECLVELDKNGSNPKN